MLHWFRNHGLRRLAIVVAALYAFCVSAPSAALALNKATAEHCLTELQVRAPAAPHSHTHADGTVHQHHYDDGAAAHHSNSDGRSQPASCCAAFFISGLAAQAVILLAVRAPAPADFPTLDDHLSGRTPERINRPPIA